MENQNNLEKLQGSLEKIEKNENIIYFLCYDIKNNPRAAVKHIYDIALILKQNGFNSKILVEDKTYSGVSNWYGNRYDDLEIVRIKDDKVEIKIEDTIVVPEYYSNILPELQRIRCNKIILLQQKEYMFETLEIGSRWSDYGFDRCITTTNAVKNYVSEIFPETMTFVIPPIIEDNFSQYEKTPKPFVAIHCRDRMVNRKIISEFYLKYPQFRWITFRDMVQMPYDDFSEQLKECFVSLWSDDESTFGTYPLESMKCGVPIIGKIPTTEPDWLNENGMWTYSNEKLVDILGSYTTAWLEGAELDDEVKQKMRETLLPYQRTTVELSVVSIFNSIINKRKETIIKTIEKLKEEV